MRVYHFAHAHPSVEAFRALCAGREEDHRWWMAEDASAPSAEETRPDVIVVHRMKRPVSDWLQRFPDVPVVWVAWGDDYYRAFPGLMAQVYSPRTRRLALLIGKLSVTFPGLGRAMMNGGGSGGSNPEHWIPRVHAVSTLLGSAFPALPHLPPGAQTLHSWYNAFDYTRHEGLKANVRAEAVILGNSAGIAGNHLDGMHWLSRTTTKQEIRPVFVYGSKRVRWALDRLGRWRFGARWNPLQTRMSKEDYLEWMCGAFAIVIPARRSVSAGTLFLSLWMGQKVVMHPLNPLFHAMRDKGFVVFNMEEMGDAGWAEPLPEADLETNRRLLRSHYAEEAIHQSMDAYFASLKGGHSG
jgi:hypothetical protein